MSSDAQAAVVRSYAKVNVALDVLEKRPNGYHAIESVMQSISLHDTVTLSVQAGSGIRLLCDVPGIPQGTANLAYRAAALLVESCKIARLVGIRIEKRIPPEAGLGGGSSNGAAALRGLNHILGLSMSEEEMRDLAAKLGSDVPFFLVGGTAFVYGRGERVEPLPDIPRRWLAVVKPPFGVSTAWAYNRLDEMRREEPRRYSRRMLECIRAERWERVPELLGNDLELPVLERHTEAAEIKQALVGAGARAALVCGSGSAVFGLFDSEAEAYACTRALDGVGEVFVTRTVTRAEAEDIG